MDNVDLKPVFLPSYEDHLRYILCHNKQNTFPIFIGEGNGGKSILTRDRLNNDIDDAVVDRLIHESKQK